MALNPEVLKTERFGFTLDRNDGVTDIKVSICIDLCLLCRNWICLHADIAIGVVMLVAMQATFMGKKKKKTMCQIYSILLLYLTTLF